MRRYFVSGGTGFIGRAIVRELCKREDTEAIWLLTRHAQLRYEMLAWDKRIVLFEGDITQSAFPSSEFTDIIHGANEANDLLQPDQDRYYYTVVEGTQRIVEWWRHKLPLANFMLLSSGAIFKGDTIYARAKRMAEKICKPYPCDIARIFSVIGEEMPLNGQYAAGRFFAQSLQGEVRYYDAGYVRSYLHVDDCASWLVDLMGRYSACYDIGSLDAVPVDELAQRIAVAMNVPAVRVATPAPHPTALVYLPRENRLPPGCKQTISLDVSIRRICDHICATHLASA